MTDVFNVTTRSNSKNETQKKVDSFNINTKSIELDSETEEFYFVDSIVDDKIVKGQKYYKVRWKGYSPNEDSWEPESHLISLPKILEEYQKSKLNESKLSGSASESPKKANRIKQKFSYEYVPKHQLVASKTKDFDDIINGKIDLTSYDLYSRVKTRKRLIDRNPSLQLDLQTEGSFEFDSETDQSLDLISCNSAPASPKNIFKPEILPGTLNESFIKDSKSGQKISDFKKIVATKASIRAECAKRKLQIKKNTEMNSTAFATVLNNADHDQIEKIHLNGQLHSFDEELTFPHISISPTCSAITSLKTPIFNKMSSNSSLEKLDNGIDRIKADAPFNLFTEDTAEAAESGASSTTSNTKSDATDAACFINDPSDELTNSSRCTDFLPTSSFNSKFTPNQSRIFSFANESSPHLLSANTKTKVSPSPNKLFCADKSPYFCSKLSGINSDVSSNSSRVTYNITDFFNDYSKALRDGSSINSIPTCRLTSEHIEISNIEQFCSALSNNQWSVISELTDEQIIQIFTKSSTNGIAPRHPLQIALWEAEGRPQFLDRLYRLGHSYKIDFDSIDSYSGYSYVHLSVLLGRLSALKWFLEHGAKPNAHEIFSGRDRTLLGEAIIQGNLSAISILLLHGANLYQVEKNTTAHALVQRLLESHALNRPHFVNETENSNISERRLSSPTACLMNHRHIHAHRPLSSELSAHSDLSQPLLINAIMHQSHLCHGNIPVLQGPEIHCNCLPSVEQLRRAQEIITQYHLRLSNEIHSIVNDWLSQYSLQRVAVLHHCLWCSIKDISTCFDFTWTNKNQPNEDQSDTLPILLLVHGKILAPAIFDLWIDSSKGPCLVQQVLVNGVPQRPIGEHLFSSTVLVNIINNNQTSSLNETSVISSSILENSTTDSTNRIMVAFKQSTNYYQCSIAMILLLVKPYSSPGS